MKAVNVELLYFDGCPNAEVAERVLRQALVEEEIEAEITSVSVESDEEAQNLRFPGSPTIRIDGEDAFPVPGRENWALACRTYNTPEGLRGAPTVDMIRPALSRDRG